MQYHNDDEYYPEFEHDDFQEEAQYRSLNFATEAAAQTSFGDHYEEDEEPVYRSVSLAPMPTNSFFEPPSSSWGAFAAPKTMPGLVDIAPPKLSRFNSPTQMTTKAAPAVPEVPIPAVTTEPKELCVLYQLEQTHLVMLKPVDEIVSAVSKALQAMGAIFEFKAPKHKFKCHLHSRSATVPFHVRIFTQNGKYVVECQKRGGCSMQFCKIWRSLRDSLTSTSTPTLDTMTSSPAIQLGPPTSTATTRPAGAIRSALGPLVEMVRSGKVDLQRSALISLDMLSLNTTSAKELLLEDDAMQYLCESVGDLADNECRSRALSAICNLLTVGVNHGLTAKAEEHAVAVIDPITQILRCDTEVACLNLHVQAARALSCISSAAKSSRSILANDDINSLLECKVQQCSSIAFADHSASSLVETQQQVAANIATFAF